MFLGIFCPLSLLFGRFDAVIPVSVPFDHQKGLIFIEGQLGSKSGHFLLDTGADVTLIDGPSSSSDDIMTSLGQEFNVDKVVVSSLRIASIERNKIEVYQTDLSHLETFLNMDILGIVGSGFFSQHAILINYDDQSMSIIDPNQIDKSSYSVSMPYTLDNNLPVVVCSIEGTKYLFGVDSGSSISIIDQKLIDHLSIKNNKNSVRVLKGLNSDNQSQSVTIGDISISKLRVKDLELAVCHLDKLINPNNKNVRGLLSLNSLPLESLVIDFKNQHIHWNFN